MSRGTVYAAPKCPDVVPSDYDDLFTTYYDYVVSLVTSCGIDPQNSEDVAMTILATFFEKDALSDFDPNYTSEYGGVVRKAVFRTFLSGFVKIYVRHYRNRQSVRKTREPIILNQEVGATGNDALTYLDLIGPTTTDDHDDLAYFRFVRYVSQQLSDTKPAGSTAKFTLSDFFVAVAEQVEQCGYLSVPLLAQSMGVGQTSIYNWLNRLRAELPSVLP